MDAYISKMIAPFKEFDPYTLPKQLGMGIAFGCIDALCTASLAKIYCVITRTQFTEIPDETPLSNFDTIFKIPFRE